MTPVEKFSALADATRCRVVELLSERAMPVHELTAAFSISRPAISRHLRVLKEAGLVKELKQGRENVYSLQRPMLKPMQTWLARHEGSPPAAKAAAPRRARPVASPVSSPVSSPVVEPVAVPRPVRRPPAPKVAASRDVGKVMPKPAASLQLDLF